MKWKHKEASKNVQDEETPATVDDIFRAVEHINRMPAHTDNGVSESANKMIRESLERDRMLRRREFGKANGG